MQCLAILILGAIIFFVPSSAVAQQSLNRLKAIDTYLQNGVDNGFSGFVVVKKSEKLLLANGYGYSIKHNKLPNNIDTVFDIGSNTKQFTAAAILRLVELGKLKLDQPLSDFFANIPRDKQDITVHQLLTHSSGLVESIGGDFDHIAKDDFLTRVFNSTLLFSPSTRYSYSNIGYSILASIIEDISGQSYEAFLQHHFFKPLDMKHTGYLLPKWNNSELAHGYPRGVLDMGTSVQRYLEDKKVSWHLLGNGGINSNAKDLMQWVNALRQNKILTKESTATLLKPHQKIRVLQDGSELFYGYGWGVTVQQDGRHRISHNGANGKFAHSIIWYPEQHHLILFATNADSPELEGVAKEIEQLMLVADYQALPIKKNPYLFVFDYVENNSVTSDQQLFKQLEVQYPQAISHKGFLNRIGLMLLEKKQTKWAIELLKQNTVLFPDDGNLHDSLADAYLQDDQTKNADEHFKKALALGDGGECHWCENAQKKLKLINKPH